MTTELVNYLKRITDAKSTIVGLPQILADIHMYGYEGEYEPKLEFVQTLIESEIYTLDNRDK